MCQALGKTAQAPGNQSPPRGAQSKTLRARTGIVRIFDFSMKNRLLLVEGIPFSGQWRDQIKVTQEQIKVTQAAIPIWKEDSPQPPTLRRRMKGYDLLVEPRHTRIA
jgi:hypothetical protein